MTEEKKLITCERCGAISEYDSTQKYCSYCGQKIVNGGSFEYTYIKRDEARIKESERKELTRLKELELENARIKANENQKEREQKFKIGAVIAAFVAILIIIGAISSAIESEKQRKEDAIAQGKITAGDYSDYKGENYKAVVKQLKSLGFTNIVTVDLKDSGLEFWNNGKVKSVSINGKDNFNEDDYFFPDAKIIIKYH